MSTAEENSVAVFVPQAITFDIAADQIALIAEDYGKLWIAGVNDSKGYKAVHEARMHVRDKRLAVDKRRKELKADALEYGRAVEKSAQDLIALLEPIETRLGKEEERIDLEKKRIKAEQDAAEKALIQARVDAFAAVGCVIEFIVAQLLTPDEYKKKLAEKTELHRLALEKAAEEEAERKRIEAQAEADRKAEAERLDAQRIEQDRIAKEQAAKAEELAAKQKAIDDELAAKQKLIDDANRAEEERLAAERKKLADAQAAEAKRIADAKAEEERKAESERLRKQAEIDAKAKLEREVAEKKEKERKAEERRARAEARKPDKHKLLVFADAVDDMELPRFSEATTTSNLVTLVEKFLSDIRLLAEGLETA